MFVEADTRNKASRLPTSQPPPGSGNKELLGGQQAPTTFLRRLGGQVLTQRVAVRWAEAQLETLM